MRKVPVFLLAISLAALLAGCAGQTAPLGGAAQLGALSATAVTGEAVADEKQDVPAPADAPDVENRTQWWGTAYSAGAADYARTASDACTAAGARTERIRTYTCAGTGAGAYTYPRT